MKNRIFSMLAALACAALLVSCSGGQESGKNAGITAEVLSVGMNSISVKVNAEGADSYYIKAYKASAFSGITPELVSKALAKRVDAGESWASFLNFGPQTFTFEDLLYGTDYKILVFGLRGDGSLTEDVVVLDVTTGTFTAKIEVSDVSYFGFKVNVTPSDNECTWYPVVVDYNALANYGIELKPYLIATLMDSDFENSTFRGAEEIYNICNPGDHAIFAVVAVDSKKAVVSEVFSVKVDVPFDGFPTLAEASSNNIHLALYNSERIAIGSMIEVTEAVYDSFVFSMIDVNNVNGSQHGINFDTASKDEISSFMVSYAQQTYDELIGANPSYYQFLEPYHRMSLLPIFSTASSFERTWDPVTRDQMIVDNLETVSYAAILLTIDDNEKISAVPGSFALARYKF